MMMIFKRKLAFIVTVVVSIVHASFIAAEIPNERSLSNTKQLAYLKFPYGEWPLVIEDGEYQEDLINDVIDDISSFYARFDSYEKENYPEAKKFIIKGDVIESHEYLQFDGAKSFTHPALREHFGSLVDIDGRIHIVLPRTLMNIYRKSVNLKKNNLDTYRGLRNFIAKINLLSDKSVEYDTANKLYYIEHLNREDLTSLKRSFGYGNAPYIKNNTYYIPSLLDIRKEVFNSIDYTICEVTSYNKVSKMIAKITLIYDAEKWKIVVPDVR